MSLYQEIKTGLEEAIAYEQKVACPVCKDAHPKLTNYFREIDSNNTYGMFKCSFCDYFWLNTEPISEEDVQSFINQQRMKI